MIKEIDSALTVKFREFAQEAKAIAQGNLIGIVIAYIYQPTKVNEQGAFCPIGIDLAGHTALNPEAYVLALRHAADVLEKKCTVETMKPFPRLS